MKKTLFTLLSLLIGFSSLSQVTDIDGNEYKTVKIGEYEITTQNISVKHFRNGDEIFHAQTKDEWKKANEEGMPAWCYYESFFDGKLDNINHGILYNWHAVNDKRQLAPMGTFIPERKELLEIMKGLYDADKLISFADEKVGNRTQDGGFLNFGNYIWSSTGDNELAWGFKIEINNGVLKDEVEVGIDVGKGCSVRVVLQKE